jgi:spermidine/putrescine transport system permease protein
MIIGGKNRFKKFYFAFMLFFLYIPFVPLFLFSFNASRSLTNWAGFSLQWYEKLMVDADIALAVINTIFIAVIATFLSVLIGTLAAIALSRSRKIIRDWLLRVNNLPIVNPEIVTAVAMLLLFISLGIPTGYLTMLLAHIGFCTPYVIITIYPKLRGLDPNVLEAAQDLGATPWQAIWKVLVPQIKTSIIAAAAIAFTMSFDDFIISYFTAGSVKNISIYLYTTKRRDPAVNAFSTIITLIVSLVVIGNHLRESRQLKKERGLLKENEKAI